MKTEETTTPAPSQASTPAPTQATYATQWASTLQQSAQASQYYSPYASHYPQAAYATHYQAYAPPIAAAQAKPVTAGQTQYQTSTYGLGTAGANSSTTTNAIDSSDIATLNDALGSAGVDLRAEEETLQQPGSSSHSYPHRSYEDRTRKQPPKPAFDIRVLGTTMRAIGTTHKISTIPDESVTYLALCLRARLQDLIVGMIKATNHRTDATFDRPASFFEDVSGSSGTSTGTGNPMWSILIRSDVAKQLAALEKAEREEETRIRKERKDRADLQAAHAAALAAQANSAAVGVSSGAVASAGDGGGAAEDYDAGGGTSKKKRKKEGPGVTARNMSEDVRKKMSNAVATQAAGLGGKYAWMTAANATSGPPLKPKPAVAATTTTAATTTGTATATTPATAIPAGTGNIAMSNMTTTGPTSSWARPYVPIARKPARGESNEQDTRTAITMRDAMFVIEKERGHGGGRGSARGWT